MNSSVQSALAKALSAGTIASSSTIRVSCTRIWGPRDRPDPRLVGHEVRRDVALVVVHAEANLGLAGDARPPSTRDPPSGPTRALASASNSRSPGRRPRRGRPSARAARARRPGVRASRARRRPWRPRVPCRGARPAAQAHRHRPDPFRQQGAGQRHRRRGAVTDHVACPPGDLAQGWTPRFSRRSGKSICCAMP